MELRRPSQYYWTTIFDQYQAQSLSFAFVPLRSFTNNQIPQLDVVAMVLDVRRLGMDEIHPWYVPTLLASILPGGGSMQSLAELPVHLASGHAVWIDPDKLGFAQYVAYSEAIPFEGSPLQGKSLMSIAGYAGVTIGLMVAGSTPLVILTVPLGILLCTAAAELGPQLGERLPKLMGFPK